MEKTKNLSKRTLDFGKPVHPAAMNFATQAMQEKINECPHEYSEKSLHCKACYARQLHWAAIDAEKHIVKETS